MKLKTVQTKSLSLELFRNAVVGILGVFSIASLSAAPIINNFSSTADLAIYGSSVSFDNNSGAGPLDATVEGGGVFGGQGIFFWTQSLSLDKVNEQYIFSLNGAESIGSTAGFISDIDFSITGPSTHYFSTGAVSLSPGGNWSLDVYEEVSQRFFSGGPVTPGLTYTVGFYIRPVTGTDGNGVVYQMDSVTATAAIPEPSTIILIGIGLAAICCKSRKKKS